MKYIVRRFFFALLTAPVVMAFYLASYFALSMVTPNSGSLYLALSNLPTLGAVYILAFSFYPQLKRFLTKL